MAKVVLESMKSSPAEAKAHSVEATEAEAPSYPYGLQYSLNSEVLEKLGDTLDDYEVGEEYYLYAKCKVVGKSEHEWEGSPPSQCVDLQITDMKIEDTAAPSIGERFYGD